jgi:hypothetical protein
LLANDCFTISGFIKLVYIGVTFLALVIVDNVSKGLASLILAIEFMMDFLAFLAQSTLLLASDPLLELEFSSGGVVLFRSASLMKNNISTNGMKT